MNFFYTSPLEQFSIFSIIPIQFGPYFLSLTNSALFLLIILSIFLYHSYSIKRLGVFVQTPIQFVYETLYTFIFNLISEQLGEKGIKRFFNFIFTIFLIILFCNLFGMIPYSFTVTSHFCFTLGLAFSLLIGITIIGFQFHGLHFLSLFLPKGTPFPLAPFLVLLEVISYLFRALSLGIRLAANMMAGHTLVKILAGFSCTMALHTTGILPLLAIFPFIIVFLLIGLEIGIALVQAYVFSMLTCIYLKDALDLH